MRIRLRNFDGGLVITPPADQIPDNALYYHKGLHRLARGAAKIRQGSTQLHEVAGRFLGIAGIYYWNNTWYYGSSNSIYQGSTCISSGTYDGNRFTFAVGGPTAGVTDYLFIAGGSTTTLRKIDSTNTVTNWGIDPHPSGQLNAVDGGTTGSLTDGAIYRYKLCYYNSKTGTRSNPTAESTSAATDAYTKLLIHCSGSSGHGSTEFVDVAKSYTITNTGATGNVTTSTGLDGSTGDPFGSTADVAFFDTTGDQYFTVPPNVDWSFGIEPFTIDFWAHFKDLPGNNSYTGIIQQYSTTGNFWALGVKNTEGVFSWEFEAYRDDVVMFASSYNIHTGMATGTWYHVAAQRFNSSGGIRFFIDGSFIWGGAAWNHNSMPDLPNNLDIGRGFGYATETVTYFSGYLSEIRVSKGVFRYVTDFTPSTSRYGSAYLDLTGGEVAADLSGIAASTDTQVTDIEIWRTGGNGTAYFLATRLPNAAQSYEDQIADDDLGIIELPTDNLKPFHWFDDCVVHNASMFWLTRSQEGERGRAYYSPIGRLEAVQGFINVTDDGEPLKRFVKYGTGLGVFSEGGFYEILGENPYYSRRVPGIPGTIEPFSVAITPYGVGYEAADGPRLLTGSRAELLGAGTVDALFQGEDRGQLKAFSTDTVATYARDEYIICNAASSNSLAVNLRTKRWRDLGILVDAIHYSEETDQIAIAHVATTGVSEFEKEGEEDDSGTGIPFALETKHVNVTSQEKVLIRNVFIDADTSNTTMSVALVSTSGTKTLTELLCNGRAVMELPVNLVAREFGVRITSTMTGNVEIYGIDFEVYVPQEERG